MPLDSVPQADFRGRLGVIHRARLNQYLLAHPEKERLRASLHLLLGALLHHCWPDKVREDGRAVCWPALQTLADTYGFPPRSIRRMLRELEDTGVVVVLNGCAVPLKDRKRRVTHDGGFVRSDGSRVGTSRRAYQFVFSCELPASQVISANNLPDTEVPTGVNPIGGAVMAPRVPARGPLPIARSYLAESAPCVGTAVPRLPPAKRTEIEAEIGRDGCEQLIAQVAREWQAKAPVPSKPYDFWNARLHEWQAHRAESQSAATADREVVETARRARAVQDDHARTAADRPMIAADLQARLVDLDARTKGVVARA